MAENALGRLARLLGGVVLLQGRLGHQILGQLLVYDTDEAAIAGATVVIAATTRQRNAIAQAAIRTAAPAIAVRSLIHRDMKRLEAKEALLAERQRRIKERDEAIVKRERDLNSGRTALVAARRSLAPRVLRDASQRIADLEKERDALNARLAAHAVSPPPPPAYTPPVVAPLPSPSPAVAPPASATPVARARRKAASSAVPAGAKPVRGGKARSRHRQRVTRKKARRKPGAKR